MAWCPELLPGCREGRPGRGRQGAHRGVPVIDFKATLYDGSFHNVDSDELSFRLAGALATRQGIEYPSPCSSNP